MQTRNIVILVLVTALFSAVCTATALKLISEDVAVPVAGHSTLEQRLARLENRVEDMLSIGQALNERPVRPATENSADDSEELKEKLISISRELSEENQQETMQAQRQAMRDAMDARRAMQQPEAKIQRLREAGFSNDEASHVVRTESEVMLEQLQAQYEARRKALESGDSTSPWNRIGNNSMREKLGDELYERYLQANGQPTAVGVGTVMENSPGANAGLLPGDKIISYNNARVFNARELNRLTALGTVGESSLLEIERDGSPLQLTIPRGPIGITDDGSGFRR